MKERDHRALREAAPVLELTAFHPEHRARRRRRVVVLGIRVHRPRLIALLLLEGQDRVNDAGPHGLIVRPVHRRRATNAERTVGEPRQPRQPVLIRVVEYLRARPAEQVCPERVGRAHRRGPIDEPGYPSFLQKDTAAA